MAQRKAAAVFGAAVLLVAFTILGQGSTTETWNNIGQFELNSIQRHKLRASSRAKALNMMMDVPSYTLYPQLTQQTGCRQLIDYVQVPNQLSDQEVPPLSQTCTDDVCLVEAMFMKTRFIIIDNDIDISNSLPLPTITTNVVISGKCMDHACKIDALGVGQIFVVSVGGQLTLRNLEIKGGYFSEGGAAVLVTGSSSNEPGPSGRLLALNVLFYNNTASGTGGAILLKMGGFLHVRNSVFDSNEASKGGAVYVQSSNDMDTDNTGCGPNSCATFVGTAFMGNWADFGGAIYVNDAATNCIQPGKFECTTCSFHDNFALEDGGAIFLARKYRGATGNVKFSSFYSNTVEVASEMTGGAVAIEAGNPGGLGVEFNSYESIYSQSFDNEIAVSVKAFANATLTHSYFLNNNTIACYGACNVCPILTESYYLANTSNIPIMTPTYGTTSSTCPEPPPPLCDWIPSECNLPMTIAAPASAPAPAPRATSCMCKCPEKQKRTTCDDPHFYGKHGEHFGFQGRNGRDYCVITDKELQINMQLFQGLRKTTSFISMLGILYMDDKILLNAQAHTNACCPSQQWAVTINNMELGEGNAYSNPNNGLNLTTNSKETQIHVPGAMDLIVSVIPGTSGTRGSGANYLNLKINYINVSPAVHGILGQSYQETKEAYKKLYQSQHMGQGHASTVLLDGTQDDYLTTSILSTDCKFALFQGGSTFGDRVNIPLHFSAAPEKLESNVCTGVGDENVCPWIDT